MLILGQRILELEDESLSVNSYLRDSPLAPPMLAYSIATALSGCRFSLTECPAKRMSWSSFSPCLSLPARVPFTPRWILQ